MSDLKYLPVTTTVTVAVLSAKLRKNERNRKEKLKFYFSFPSASNFGEANVTKKRAFIMCSAL